VTHPAQTHQGEQDRIFDHLLSDHSFPMPALLLGMRQILEMDLQQRLLAHRPGPGLLNQGRSLFTVHRVRSRKANPLVAEIGVDAVDHLGRSPHRLHVGMKAIPAFLSLDIRNPDPLGRPRQIGFGDAHGADLVIVGMGLLEFSQLSTLQDQRLATHRGQSTHRVKAVSRSLQNDAIPGIGVLLSPFGQLADGNFVEYLLGPSRRRRFPAQYGGGETVGMTVQTDGSRAG